MVNPSSGGEQAKNLEQLAIANWNRCLMKWSSCIQKAGCKKLLLAKRVTEGYHSVFVMGGDGTVKRRNQWNRWEQEHYRPNFGIFPHWVR